MPLEKKEVKDQEDPEQKFTAFANRDNSDFKWQRARNVLGVLEVYSEPVLKPREEMKPRYFKGREKIFEEALVAWDKTKLQKELVEALENLPAETACCGFLHDGESTKKETVKLLKNNWVKKANKKMQPHGFKIDIFLWNWQNASGKAETNIILVRFFVVASYGLRAASKSGGFDVDEEENDKSAEKSIISPSGEPKVEDKPEANTDEKPNDQSNEKSMEKPDEEPKETPTNGAPNEESHELSVASA